MGEPYEDQHQCSTERMLQAEKNRGKRVIGLLKAVTIGSSILEIACSVEILESTKQIKVVGNYSNEHKAIKGIEQINPDVAFIIIDGSNSKNYNAQVSNFCGLKIAQKIKIKHPHVKIVFMAKSKEYAVEAFELGAADYLLIPVSQSRIQKTIERIMNDRENPPVNETYTIGCFKNLHFKYNDKEIKNAKWRTSKAKELFAFLMHNRNETVVRKDVIIDLLWPEEDVEKAYDKLYSAICQVRATLKNIGIDIDIVSRDHAYEILFNNVSCEVDDWEKEIKKMSVISDENIDYCLELIDQYTGDYLAEESYVWVENEQERLRVLYQAFSNEVLQYLYNSGKYTEASLLALKNQQLYPYLQDSYLMLMRIYDKQGDIHNVEKQYFKLNQMMKEEFDTLPNEEIRNWYRNWIKNIVQKI